MREALQFAAWLVSLSLEILILWALLRGAYRDFPFIFAYVTVLILTTAIEIAAYSAQAGAAQLARSPAFYYWVNEGVLAGLIFCVVVSLLYRATAGLRNRASLRAAVICGATLFPGISFLTHFGRDAALSMWMTRWSRDMNFVAAILDLALWAALIGRRTRDQRLLLLSGAMGIQFAGEAMGQSLRQLSRATLWPGNILILFANLTCLYVWWRAFRTTGAERGSALKEPASRV